MKMRAQQAFEAFMKEKPDRVLNVGGTNDDPHTTAMRAAGIKVLTVDLRPPADIVTPYSNAWTASQDAIWCSHVLEHQRNPGQFIDKLLSDLNDGGLLAITVPPPKPSLLAAHVTGWNETILLLQLIYAGLDCSAARVWSYGYNISCLVRKVRAELPEMHFESPDLPVIAKYLPKGWSWEKSIPADTPRRRRKRWHT